MFGQPLMNRGTLQKENREFMIFNMFLVNLGRHISHIFVIFENETPYSPTVKNAGPLPLF